LGPSLSSLGAALTHCRLLRDTSQPMEPPTQRSFGRVTHPFINKLAATVGDSGFRRVFLLWQFVGSFGSIAPV